MCVETKLILLIPLPLARVWRVLQIVMRGCKSPAAGRFLATSSRACCHSRAPHHSHELATSSTYKSAHYNYHPFTMAHRLSLSLAATATATTNITITTATAAHNYKGAR